MKKLLLLIILATTMLIATSLYSAEVIPIWNRSIEGEVQDIEFLKGQDEILLLVGEGPNGQIQRRNPENGDLIHSFPNPLSTGSKFAITPDSLRIVHINGNGGLLRSIDEKFTVLKAFDVAQEDSIIITYSVIAIDPVRPYVYVTTYGWNKKTNLPAPRGKVISYNYETGEHIKDLTPYGEYEYTAIEVSHDGRYLATLNDGETYLKVWDLNTMELIINEPLFEEFIEVRCEAEDIYFSKLDPDLIYYSGKFTKKVNVKWTTGNFTFNISKKEKKRVANESLYSGEKILLFNKESRILNSAPGVISVLNTNSNEVEYYGDPEKVYKNIVRYNQKENYFISSSNNLISKYLYDSKTSVVTNFEEEITISPNPTNSFVNINFNCTDPLVNYQINDVNGLMLYQSSIQNKVSNSLQIDFSSYPTGVYFVTINCNVPKTYKIIKQN